MRYDYQKILQTDYSAEVAQGLSLMLTENVSRTQLNFISLSALALITREQDCDTADELSEYVKSMVEDSMTRDHLIDFAVQNWSIVKQYSNAIGIKALVYATLFADISISLRERNEGCSQTPAAVSELALKILDLHEDDVLLDQCSGVSNLLVHAAAFHPFQKAVGIEITSEGVIAGRIRALFLPQAFSVQQGNVLTEDYRSVGANKVFSDVPVGQFLRDNVLPQFADFVPHAGVRHADWYFALAAILNQSKSGRTVIVDTPALGFRGAKERQFRKRITEEGYLEAVIALPANLYALSAAAVNLYVFSEHNREVRLVNAAHLGKKVKTMTILDASDVDRIYRAFCEDGKHSKRVTIGELRETGYDWSPNRYLMTFDIPNGVKLGDAAIAINRGSNVNYKELEALKSSVPTQYRYIQLQNLDNGRVAKDLTYLKTIDVRDQKSLVKGGDLLVSRMAPFKIAVMPDIEGEQVLTSGNLYAIRLNPEIFDPVYVMLYLSSHSGKKMLQTFAKGTVLVSLSRKDLEQILIPKIPLEEQRKLSEEYRKLSERLMKLKQQEYELQSRIDALYDERKC